MFDSGILVNTSRGLSARLTVVNKETGEEGHTWFNNGVFGNGRALLVDGETNIEFRKVNPAGKDANRQLVMKGTVNGEPWVAFRTDHAHILSITPDERPESAGDPVAFSL